MDKVQLNQKERNDTLIQFLNDNTSNWSSIPKVGEIIIQFTHVNNGIHEAYKAQTDSKVFLGTNKFLLKKSISEKADILNDLLEAFAAITGNAELEKRMATSASNLLHLKNEDFILKVKEVIIEAENNINVLRNEYGMTNEQLEDIKINIDNYLNLKGKPRAFKIASAQATADIASLIKEANDILANKLNKVMKVFKHRNTNFYNGYIAASTIVDD